MSRRWRTPASSVAPLLARHLEPILAVGCAATLVASTPSVVRAEDTVQRSLTVRAEFSTRTSLKIQSEVLHFDVTNADMPAAGALEFSAGTRTQVGGEVLLILEPLAASHIAAADHEREPDAASKARVPQAVGAVDLSTPGPKVAARWIGSGLRHGTVPLTFRASHCGRYEVPLRVVLTAP